MSCGCLVVCLLGCGPKPVAHVRDLAAEKRAAHKAVEVWGRYTSHAVGVTNVTFRNGYYRAYVFGDRANFSDQAIVVMAESGRFGRVEYLE